MSEGSEVRGMTLTGLARGALVEAFGGPAAVVPAEDWLRAPGATFVTLTEGGELRGCIGTIEAQRALFEDVMRNARAAAFEDPRFAPLERHELERVRLEVTVLSALEVLDAGSEAEVLRLLRPGVDGVLLECHHRRGVFIPQMWERLSSPGDFLRHLKLKAGLPSDRWVPETRVSRFTAAAYEERSTA